MSEVVLHRDAPSASTAGWVGLACGLVSLAVALVPAWVAPLYDPPSKALSEYATDWLGQLKDQAAAATGMAPEPVVPELPPNPWRDPRFALGALLLGFGALTMAAIGFARREDPRVVACALTLGAGAIATERLLTALMILLFALVAVALVAVARRAAIGDPRGV